MLWVVIASANWLDSSSIGAISKHRSLEAPKVGAFVGSGLEQSEVPFLFFGI